MFNLENAIKSWLKQFRKHQAFDEGEIKEVEVHLRDHLDDLVATGISEKEAFQMAVKDFGHVPEVAKDAYTNIQRTDPFRSILLLAMFRNYFKTFRRGMGKHPLSSFINVFGLAVAVGICLVVYAFLDNDYSIDRHHVNKDRVFLTTFFVDREGTQEQYGKTPAPLARMLGEDHANIEKITRVHDASAITKFEEKVFQENVRFVDPEFLEMMTFPLKWGSSTSLEDVNSLIISERTSVKYFGDQNPVGRNLLVKFAGERSKSFTVTGVAEKFPAAHIIDFDLLVNFENVELAIPSFDNGDWKTLVNATLVQVSSPSDLVDIKANMDKYKTLQNQVERDWAIEDFNFVSIHDLHLASKEIRDDISYDSSLEGRVVLPIIAVFMIFLACFNYINIAVVSATKRLKEIGLRKVIGAGRRSLIIQFLSENMLVTLLAGLIGLLLGVLVFLPWFVDLSSMPLSINLLDGQVWLFLIAVLLLTGLLSGLYPAFYISKFEVISIFKGTVKFGKKNRLTKFFLGIQLVMACVGITGAVMFTQNSGYQAERSWGYDQHHTLYATLPDPSTLQQLKTLMDQTPHVVSTASSKHHLGRAIANTIIHLPERHYEVQELSVSPGYFETMGLSLQEGRLFKPHHQGDKKTLVVNELFTDNIGIKDPIGQVIKIDSSRYEIIGVVNNFHYNSFYYENRPLIFTMTDREQEQFLTVQVEKGNERKVYGSLQKHWGKLLPETPFQGGYQDEVWLGFYEELGIMKKFTIAVGSILVLLAGLGLYGLVKLNIAGRIREFSIRKVMGAQLANIASTIFRQYLLLSMIVIAVGAPISHLLITANIDMMFPDPRPFGYSGVLMAVFILIGVLITVIATQIRKVLRSNPVEGLKVE